ncbi:MAG TPA: bifunctional UDP-N-acetylglucosamine diphosphorylase/glucosamine-1-phosphate N-acetyltransferase GlmU [Thermohalobaculum sp.]|nr:bifunctional UDP-N-acetylglucosamine diphosphorylase/glucosamine-1-phosphate N-acetyltransferase GlmU [Thermohalobaculum sp.]
MSEEKTDPPPRTPAAVVILAAGQGTRMRSDRPKVLHPIGGTPMLHHAMRAALSLGPERIAVVVSDAAGAVADAARALAPEARICEQAERLGTGHAVRQAEAALEGFAGDLFVLFADTPFLSAGTLGRMRAARAAGADIVSLGFEAAEPGGYGRMVTGPGDALERIVEARDASEAERAIRTCNSGVLAADAATLTRLLARVSNRNAKGEYYLTDVVALARAEGLTARLVRCDEAETLGVNDRVELAAAEAAFQARARRAAMLAGATMTAPETVFLAWDTAIGRDVTIGPHVVLGPGVEIADGAEIRAFSHLEGCRVGPGAVVGPFARLRPGTDIGEGARIGNFVEIKNAVIGPGAKANHLSYVGDASVGERANLGAGTVTCNYDGFAKHRTEIGAGAFIGVNTALVAPVSVGDNAYVGTGTVVTSDVPAEALALARAPQTIREGFALRLRARLKARAEEKNRDRK